MPRYPVPDGKYRAEYLQSNSRFIATLLPVATMEEAREALAQVREEMPDATHHVHAARVGFGSSVTDRMSDDGEPSGTSGPPILAILRGSGWGDLMVVVTRYYGGTKLGTGGLVTAYGEATRTVLAIAKSTIRIDRSPLVIDLDYADYEPARRLVLEHEGLIRDEVFGETVRLTALLPTEALATFQDHVRSITSGRVRFPS